MSEEERRLRTSIRIIEDGLRKCIEIREQELDLFKAWIELLEMHEEELTRKG